MKGSVAAAWKRMRTSGAYIYCSSHVPYQRYNRQEEFEFLHDFTLKCNNGILKLWFAFLEAEKVKDKE
jgi:hypothetical protein